MMRTLAILLLPLLTAINLHATEEKSIAIVPRGNTFLSWLQVEHPISDSHKVYNTKLPKLTEIRKVQELLVQLPASLPDLPDNGNFANVFAKLVTSLKKFKPSTLDELMCDATWFFTRLNLYSNCWMIDKGRESVAENSSYTGRDQPYIPSDQVDVATLHQVYGILFQEHFSIIQRVANCYFQKLAENGKHNPTLSHQQMDWIEEIQPRTRLCYLTDDKGYLPFGLIYAPNSGIRSCDLLYGQPIIIEKPGKTLHLRKKIIVDNNQIIAHNGILIEYAQGKLPICIQFYNRFKTWDSSYYYNPRGIYPQQLTWLKHFSNVIDVQEIIRTRNTKFMALPTSMREKQIFTLLVLTKLKQQIDSESSNEAVNHQIRIKLDSNKAKQLAGTIELIEEQLIDDIAEEFKRHIRDQQEEISRKVARNEIPGRTTRPPKRSRRRKNQRSRGQRNAPAKLQTSLQRSSYKETSQPTLTEEQINAKVKKQLEQYKVEGRQKFKDIMQLVNKIMNDPELVDENQNKLKEVFEQMQVNITGSHITYHTKKAPVTLVRRHGPKKDDHTYYHNQVNAFVEKFIYQAISNVFS
ncbi:MAG: hypothetical protein ABFQ95_02015 [Pseudomonadota bacterium]